jgi:hypothetical protein
MINAADFPDWGQLLHRYLEPLVAVMACLLSFAVIRFTIWGLDIRATGGNAVAARFAGIHVTLVRLNVALFSGALVGLAGEDPQFIADIKAGKEPSQDPSINAQSLPQAEYGCAVASSRGEWALPWLALGIVLLARRVRGR